jgi:hypothetical protein
MRVCRSSEPRITAWTWWRGCAALVLSVTTAYRKAGLAYNKWVEAFHNGQYLTVDDLLVEHCNAQLQHRSPLDQHALDGSWIAADVIGQVLANLPNEAAVPTALVKIGQGGIAGIDADALTLAAASSFSDA